MVNEEQAAAEADEQAQAENAQGQAPATETPAVEEELTEVEALQVEVEESKSRLLRSHADLENFRKRSSRELATERRYAAMPLLRDIVPVIDDIQRAIDAAEQSDPDSGLLEGFKLVAQQLRGALAKHECTEIKALGEEFDPNLHEAISYLPSPDHAPNTVMTVTSTGYVLHDRVVRPSQVVVAAPLPE